MGDRATARGRARWRVGLGVGPVAALLGALLPATVAGAAFHGADGPLVFESTRAASVSFCGAPAQGSELFVLAAGATDPVQLTCTSADDEHPSISPDGSTVIFSSTRGGPVPQLYTVPLTTPPSTKAVAPTLVSAGHGAADDHPSWSPTGDGTVVFQRTLPGGLSQLYLENVSAPSAAVPVFPTTTGFADMEPVFDPSDTAVIAFVRLLSGHTHIFSYDLATHALVDLSAAGDGGDGGDDTTPAFSPRSSGPILFASDRACGFSQLYTMHRDGSDPEPVFRRAGGAPQCTEDDRNAVFSPQGDAIAYDRPGFAAQESDVLPLGRPVPPHGQGSDEGHGTGGGGDGGDGSHGGPGSGGGPSREPFEVTVDASGTATGIPTLITDNTASNTEPDWGPQPTPPSQAPESPLPVLLPVLGVGAAGTVLVRQRRRARPTAH